jgi:hypothetical protein
LNLRKRGPTLSKPGRHSKTASTSEGRETQVSEWGDDSSSDDSLVYDRPAPTPVVLSEYSEPDPKKPRLPISNEDRRPASAYLPLGEGEFRLLQLAPGRNYDPVVCSFVTASKSRLPEYEAVSYIWGVQQTFHAIMLRDPQGQLHPIYIRSNLGAALRSIRHPKVTRSFWVDALCINHSNANLNEKNRLVSMKPFIFHNAQNLCFWLDEDASSKAALNFIPRMLDLSSLPKLIRDDKAVNDWIAFIALLNNPSFSRLWLVQEVSVARNATLHCGQTVLHYKDLVDAMAMFTSSRNDISLLFRRNKKNYKELFDRKITMAERFINVSANALRITSPEKVERRFSLEDLISQLKDLTTTDPLDRIYSVLAIARDGPEMGGEIPVEYDTRHKTALQIDYDRSPLELYQDFVIHAIERSGSLDIICRDWARSVSNLNLPTWVRPLQTSFRPNSDISERIDSDSLVGLPGQNHYNASRGTVAHFHLGLGQSHDSPKPLFVRGFRIDTISKLGPRAEDGIILHEWLELGGVVGEIVPEAFWRTLVADRSPNGSVAPSWYSRAFLYCLRLSPTGNINTNRLIDESEAEPSLIIDFLQRVQSVIWNRKFLVSEGNGWIGLGPMASQVGDEIYVLDGCTVPVVLRRQQDIDSHGFDFLQLVGECYVHGMMGGEAAEIPRTPELAIDRGIELR